MLCRRKTVKEKKFAEIREEMTKKSYLFQLRYFVELRGHWMKHPTATPYPKPQNHVHFNTG